MINIFYLYNIYNNFIDKIYNYPFKPITTPPSNRLTKRSPIDYFKSNYPS
jgi:hypothetical protein